MRQPLSLFFGVLFAISAWGANAPPVTAIQVTHHDGQSYIQWTDPTSGTTGNYRYGVYRSTSPITSLAGATLIQDYIFNNSGQMTAQFPFNQTTRQDVTKLMSITAAGSCGSPPSQVCGTPLAALSGLAVHTATATENAYYAVVTRDITGTLTDSPLSAGDNSMLTPTSENVAPRQPLKYYDSTDATHRSSSSTTSITGTANRPFWLKLHASGGCSGALTFGDLYQWWGDSTQGYQEGVQNAFMVYEDHGTSTFGQPSLITFPCDTAWTTDALGQLETFWSGYLWNGRLPWTSSTTGELFYPSTEAKLAWLVPWAISHYNADPTRVYGFGQSMGGWGSSTWTVRHPEIFAAVFMQMPRFEEVGVASMDSKGNTTATSGTLYPDGSQYTVTHNTVNFVTSRGCNAPLPFLVWGIGRNDGFATWQEEVDMVNALKSCHYGFAFGWNNGIHGDGPAAESPLQLQYQTAIVKNVSYPAFTNSSLDSNPGTGVAGIGDCNTGSPGSNCYINYGWSWSSLSESATTWTATLTNSGGAATVDVTPRNTQSFRPAAGAAVNWTTAAGGSGTVVADAYGLATATVSIPGGGTMVTFQTQPVSGTISGKVVLSGGVVAHD